MDPFSISVGILTVLEFLSVLVKQAKVFREASAEINALAEEIADFEALILSVEYVLQQRGSTQLETSATLISKLLSRAGVQLHQIQQLLESRLNLKVSNADERRRRKFAWLRHRRNAEDLRRRLEAIRCSLSAGLSALTSYVDSVLPSYPTHRGLKSVSLWRFSNASDIMDLTMPLFNNQHL
jgi:hypothetical protein